MRSNSPRRLVTAVATLVLVLVAAGCGSNKTPSSTGGSPGNTAGGPGSSKKVALLLPESKTTRYESQDKPNFERRLKELCPDCTLLYFNADQDVAKQRGQADAALTNGANVLVLDPVDGKAVGSIVATAKAKNVPVVSYDRLIQGAEVNSYISFDNQRVGQLQGQALVDKLRSQGKAEGTIVMINGSPTDNNATQFKKGAHSVIDKSGLKVGAEYDTPDWSPDKAQQEMEQAITRLGRGNIAGVYAANDGTASGAIAAMKAAGMAPLPPVTGQDAELGAIQRILIGEQYMTVYKAVKPEAEKAAELALAAARGEQPPAGLTNSKVNNGKTEVPSVILTPVSITKDNVKDTVIKDGFWKPSDVCTGPYANACRQAGIS